MTEFTITPKVDETQEFIEIANDFANPLDLVREAVSNSFDAQSPDRTLEIKLSFETEVISGETTFVIRLSDNGTGMGKGELQSFFDLGNSTRRGDKTTIGEKGHGTKVYFNSKRLIVDTVRDGTRLRANFGSTVCETAQSRNPNGECVRRTVRDAARGNDHYNLRLQQ